MNRHPDGRPLSTDDLFDLAVACGHDVDALVSKRAALHNDPLFRGHLDRLTRSARFSLFSAGFLALDTRPVPKSDRRLNDVDLDMLAFFTRKVAVPC